MNQPVVKMSRLAVAASLLLGVSAMAQTMSSNDYQAANARIKSEYKAEKKACASLAGNPKDVCLQEAKAAHTAAKADARVKMETADLRADASAEKREAQYKVEKEKCEALAASAKNGCRTAAKAHFSKL